jgi:hypothetical protein
MATEDDKVNTGALATLVAVGVFATLAVALGVDALVRFETRKMEADRAGSAEKQVRELVTAQRAQLAAQPLPIDRAMAAVVLDLRQNPWSATPPAPEKDAGADAEVEATDAGADAAVDEAADGGTLAPQDAAAPSAAPTPAPAPSPSAPIPAAPATDPSAPAPMAPTPPVPGTAPTPVEAPAPAPTAAAPKPATPAATPATPAPAPAPAPPAPKPTDG